MNLVENISVRKLAKEDLSVFRSLIQLFNVVFEEAEPMEAGEDRLQSLLGDDRFIAIAAFLGSEVIGGLTAYELRMYYSNSSEIFIFDMAVQETYQRQGVGKSLLNALRAYCASRGIMDFFVMAHEEDAHALDFYRATGGKGEKVVNFLYRSRTAQE